MARKAKQVATEEPQETNTLTIGDNIYSSESITERGKQLILNLQKVEQKLSEYQFEVNMASTTIEYITKELIEEANNFEQIGTVSTDETE